jgi:predicted dehydrogenase
MGISVGMVGLGWFGTGFVRLFRDHPLVDRIALCDLDKDRLAQTSRQFGIAETYGSLDEVCRTDLDALVIITQHWMHAPQAIQAMNAGKHVYSAVPIITLDDGREMLDWCDKIINTCKRTGLHYMMGETSHYRPQAMYCRRRAVQGAFGQFVYAEGAYLHDIDLPASNLREVAMHRWGKQWDPSKSGGVPMYYPTHSIGGFLSVMRAHVTEVAAMGYVFPNDDWHHKDTTSGNVFGNETALMRLSNGAVARICEYRKIGHVGYEGFSLFGSEGSFVEGPGGCHWVTRTDKTPLTVEQMRDRLPAEVEAAYRKSAGSGQDKDVYGGHGGSHAYLVHEFVDAIAHGRSPAVNAWQAVRYFAPGIIAHESAKKGGELMKVPDWGDGPDGGRE